MKKNEEILELLRKKGNELEIPSGLDPEWMRETLKEHERKQYFRKGRLYPALAAAASFCLVAGLSLHIYHLGLLTHQEQPFIKADTEDLEAAITETTSIETILPETSQEEEQDLLDLPKATYEEIYARLQGSWQQEELTRGTLKAEYEMADLAASQKQSSLEDSVSENVFGQTNTQVAEVDEADRIKNDGRYLYQTARKQTKDQEGTAGPEKQGIQIIDTKDGLKETAFIEGFENLEEFYLWEDRIITIENKYYEAATPAQTAKKETAVEDLAICGLEPERVYHEITIYDIEDKANPKKLKTFTLQGSYESSRISKGYFYGISRFTASPGEGEKDYDAYIPKADGKHIKAENIYCPAYADGTSYLVLVSIDLSNPTDFTDTRAILSGSGTYYVSPQNIYLAEYQSVYQQEPQSEGLHQDTTRLLRFSYLKGRFYAQAQGEVPGRVDNSFSLDEYESNLRIATTVQEYQAKAVTDDRTEELLGYDYGEPKETNALYILGRNLAIKGKLEGLAEGEQIKSARFLGETGYLVTFRQTDPLFAIDLSDPEEPKLLGQLKVSGFSEYLHPYGEHTLLGLGVEADEETGREEGLKLSMFDLTDPKDLKEQSRLHLKDYNYTEALWDHHAVLIDPSQNLIAFEAEGSNRGTNRQDYLVYTYDQGAFTQKLKISTKREDHTWYRTRGTYIGQTLYLLTENGTVTAYNLTTGAKLAELNQ